MIEKGAFVWARLVIPHVPAVELGVRASLAQTGRFIVRIATTNFGGSIHGNNEHYSNKPII
jgi:hypothetical protein